MMSHFLAPSAFITSSSSGSMVERPVATLTTIGKNEIRKAVMTGGIQPTPNHRIRIGTTATFGMALKPTSSGWVPALTMREAPSAMPSRMPNTTAMPKPATVIHSVWKEWNEQLATSTRSRPARSTLGAGRKNTGILKSRQAASHSDEEDDREHVGRAPRSRHVARAGAHDACLALAICERRS